MPDMPPISEQPAVSAPLNGEKPVFAREGRNALLAALAYLLFFQVTLRFHHDSERVITLSTLLSLWLTLICVVFTARAMFALRGFLVGGGLLSGLLLAPSLLVAQLYPRFPGWRGWGSIAPPFVAYSRLLGAVPGLRDLLLIGFAAAIGVLISRLIRELKILLPIGVALAVVDLYVVFGGGLVTQAQQGNPAAKAAMQSLTVTLPTVQKTVQNAAPIPVVGFADYLFIAVFFACFAKFGVPSRRTFFVLVVVLSLYMLFVLFTGMPLPALVPIAAVVILLNVRQFRYERAEAFALLYAALLLAALFGISLYLHR